MKKSHKKSRKSTISIWRSKTTTKIIMSTSPMITIKTSPKIKTKKKMMKSKKKKSSMTAPIIKKQRPPQS